ncbi:MAG: hypothetical protein IIB19_05135 [Chloroflexi bacterium]|nr:hypothetical protein [Chloroflexota bacterium]
MTQPQPEPSAIGFDFIKSNVFRVIHADGVWGGVGPHGHIQMAFFSERFPIPRRVDFELREGRLGQETGRDTREGIVREIETEIIMNVAAATSLRDWLTTKIEEARS